MTNAPSNVRFTRPVCATEISVLPTANAYLGLATVLILGAVAGFFYAYSCSVMFGLNASSPAVALEAMQGINREVRNPIFFASFFGSACLPVMAAIFALWLGNRRAAFWFAAAAILYIGGAFLPTIAVNVPMNEALALVDVSDLEDPAAIWTIFENRWTLWNHIRSGFSLLALAASAIGYRAT